MLLGQAFETGELAAPADGPVSWTSARRPRRGRGDRPAPTRAASTARRPPLTGSAALDLAGLAAEVLGRPIRRTVLTDAQYREALPEPVAEILLGLFAASRAGEFAAVDPTLGELLGRPPLTVRDVLAKD